MLVGGKRETESKENKCPNFINKWYFLEEILKLPTLAIDNKISNNNTTRLELPFGIYLVS